MIHFKELKVGQTFNFVSPTKWNSFYDRCRKMSQLTYESLDGAVYIVGSINAQVYNVEDTQHDRTSSHTHP